MINDVSLESDPHLIPPSSINLIAQAAKVNNASDRKIVILSGSKMRLE
jgi:hypothetical protein